MNNMFIVKLETPNYLIGSFDAYLDMTKSLIEKNSKVSSDEASQILNSMPTNYRAAITNKNNEYIGYIGLFNIDLKSGCASIRFETKDNLTEGEQNEILEEFKKYLANSLNIIEIEKIIYQSQASLNIKTNLVTIKPNIIIPNRFLVPGINPKDLEKFAQNYQIPNLQLPFTIKSKDRVLGIIGLSNVIWANKRANLSIFLDNSLPDDITNELTSHFIDDYINYVHASNIHSLNYSINGSNQNMLNLISKTSMNYYGFIPFGAYNATNLESNFLFQHLPNMKKDNHIIIPENQVVPIKTFDTDKKELDEEINLNNGFKLVSPKLFDEKGIDFNKIVESHIKAMQNRERFTIPLGEDKYFIQKGNDKYGITKLLKNYNYILLDENNNYAGYINILRTNGKNAEIEVGISPELQHQGLGTIVITRFYEELFKIGFASVTSAVFSFNIPSLKMHERVAELNGIRLESYYINGKLWDMNFYSQINHL